MPGHFGRLQVCLLVLWVIPFVGFAIYAFGPWGAKLNCDATQRADLKVFSNAKSYRSLDNSAEFGLEKLASVVNYLLLATAAILGFLTKALMENRTEVAKGEGNAAAVRLSRAEYLLFLHAGIACAFSVTWGVFAYLTLPDIAVVESINVTHDLGRYVLGQILGLGLAVIFVLVALGSIVRGILP